MLRVRRLSGELCGEFRVDDTWTVQRLKEELKALGTARV